MNLQDHNAHIETIELKSLTFQIEQHFGKFFLESTKITVNNLADSLAIRMRSYILGQEDHQRYSVSVDIPATWWQHFKQDHAPGWFVRRFPVKTKTVPRTVEFNHKMLFPKADVVPDHLGPVVFHTHTDENGVYKP